MRRRTEEDERGCLGGGVRGGCVEGAVKVGRRD